MIRYLVSPRSNAKYYSGTHGEKLFVTRSGAEERVRKVKKLTGKKYYISKIKIEI